MLVLVVNAGSSSLKYQLRNSDLHEVIAKGQVEKIGGEGRFEHKANDKKRVVKTSIPNHHVAIEMVLDALADPEVGAVETLAQIDAVGHRIVSGGDVFEESCICDEAVVKKIEDLSVFAPLHNKPEAACIRACMDVMPNTPQVTVFDNAFFHTMPPKAYLYALPIEYYHRYGVRKYGAHGTSHRYVSLRAAELLGKKPEEVKLITCHLGNGSSITAVRYGEAIDTSMGMTPLDGVVMGTRCGTIDPAVVPFIMEREDLTPAEIDRIMNFESGLLGVSGVSNDMREVMAAMDEGDENAKLAFDMCCFSIKKYVGMYLAELGGADAIIFTAGIGEHSAPVRAGVLEGLEGLGIKLDPAKNESVHEGEIQADDSAVKILIVPTDEERMISTDVIALCGK